MAQTDKILALDSINLTNGLNAFDWRWQSRKRFLYSTGVLAKIRGI